MNGADTPGCAGELARNGTADLEKLAAQLPAGQYAVILVNRQGARPHLHIINRHAKQMAENVYTAEGCFWWGWAERIAPVDHLQAAAAEVGRVLRVLGGGQ